MDARRQKTRSNPASAAESWGEAPRAAEGGTEASRTARAVESPTNTERLMEEICERKNLWKALNQVQGNGGSPGVDGMTVEALAGYLRIHWPALKDQLLKGTYQ